MEIIRCVQAAHKKNRQIQKEIGTNFSLTIRLSSFEAILSHTNPSQVTFLFI